MHCVACYRSEIPKLRKIKSTIKPHNSIIGISRFKVIKLVEELCKMQCDTSMDAPDSSDNADVINRVKEINLEVPEQPYDERYRQLSFQLFGEPSKPPRNYEGPFVNVSGARMHASTDKFSMNGGAKVSKPRRPRGKKPRKQSDPLGSCLTCYSIVSRVDRFNFLGRPPIDKLAASVKQRSDDLKEFLDIISSCVPALQKSDCGPQSVRAMFDSAVARLKTRPWCLCANCSSAFDLLLTKQRCILRLQQEVKDLQAKFINAIKLSKAFTESDPNFKGIQFLDRTSGIDTRTKITLNMKTVDVVRKSLLGGKRSWRKEVNPLKNFVHRFKSKTKPQPEPNLIDICTRQTEESSPGTHLIKSEKQQGDTDLVTCVQNTSMTVTTSTLKQVQIELKRSNENKTEDTNNRVADKAFVPSHEMKMHENSAEVKVEVETDNNDNAMTTEPLFAHESVPMSVRNEKLMDASVTSETSPIPDCLKPSLGAESVCDEEFGEELPDHLTNYDSETDYPRASSPFESDCVKDIPSSKQDLALNALEQNKNTKQKKKKASNNLPQQRLSTKRNTCDRSQRNLKKRPTDSQHPRKSTGKKSSKSVPIPKRQKGTPGKYRRPISIPRKDAYRMIRRTFLSEVQKAGETSRFPCRANKGVSGMRNCWDQKDGKIYFRDMEIKLNSDGKFTCPLCDDFEPADKRNKLGMHVNKYHVDTSNGWPCTHCDKKFYYHNCLEQHIKEKHGTGYQCEICGASLANRASLFSHKRVKHEGIKPHVCEHCGKGFATKKDMTIHVRRHTGERPFVCHGCGETFIDKQSMKLHIRRKHPEMSEEKPYTDTSTKHTIISN